MSDRYRIEKPRHFRLKDFDPDETSGFEDIDACKAATQADIERMRELGEQFYVDGRRSLLIVLQAMDTAGKDGTIKHVFSGLNPVGTHATSFKAPAGEELKHDYLWRISKALPAKGQFGIFNRSHYEDVLVVRVHGLVDKNIWEKRFEQINDFERRLAGEGALILKFFLHISKDEQKKRLQERLDKPEKLWKFDTGDLKEREYWADYQHAYEDVIRRCSTPWAPWYVVPANKKWHRNYVVANAIVKTLSKLKLELPRPAFDPRKIKIK